MRDTRRTAVSANSCTHTHTSTHGGETGCLSDVLREDQSGSQQLRECEKLPCLFFFFLNNRNENARDNSTEKQTWNGKSASAWRGRQTVNPLWIWRVGFLMNRTTPSSRGSVPVRGEQMTAADTMLALKRRRRKTAGVAR